MSSLYHKNRRLHSRPGFTLLELLICLAVLVVISGFGLPEMGRLLNRQRIASAHSELQASLSFARGEAIRRSAQVTICRRSAGTGSPACASSGHDWSSGWIVFADRSAEAGARDPVLGDVLEVHSGVAQYTTLTFTAPRGASLTYDAHGWPDRNFVGGSFRFCSRSDPSLGKRLVASRLGRLRSEPFDCRA